MALSSWVSVWSSSSLVAALALVMDLATVRSAWLLVRVAPFIV